MPTTTLLEDKQKPGIFDVAIIGGGYAGLSCALMLGRYRVRTIMFDRGTTRNFKTRHLHGYLGFEGRLPRTLIKRAQLDLERFSSHVTVIRKKVVCVAAVLPASVAPNKDRGHKSNSTGSHDSKYIKVFVDGGKTYSSRLLVIATGVQDIKPRIKNFEAFDGDGAWHCPHCDGHEAQGKRLAIVSSAEEQPIEFAKEFMGWTKDITIFLQEDKHASLTQRQREEAEMLGIKLVFGRLKNISGKRGNLPKKLLCENNHVYDTDVLFYKLGVHIQNGLAKQLGCELDDGYIKVDRHQETTVNGVYAAGDVDTDRHYVIFAAAAGARAAISIYERLLSEAIRVEKSDKNS
jgi:thioredoxin reductase